jgi:hypothetical protein
MSAVTQLAALIAAVGSLLGGAAALGLFKSGGDAKATGTKTPTYSLVRTTTVAYRFRARRLTSSAVAAGTPFMRITSLHVREVPTQGTVDLLCWSRACGGATRLTRRTFPAGALDQDLTALVARRALAVDDRLQVQITKAGVVGKVVRITIVATPRVEPRLEILCLPPQAAGPQPCPKGVKTTARTF